MIDVIIPVYNGYAETKQCIDSLLNCENRKKIRFIFINDNSPNKEISDLLERIKDSRVIVLTNKQNLGFVKTVNIGMRYSNNDVILLNSDTVVTNFWIDKLFLASQSHKKVGTVTCLTNNGTIASVPNFNQDNEIPKGYTIEQFSQLVEQISKKLYPTIPTAVGHAMFIKRDALNAVGFFDEETFGMGYGEENDFSCRLIKKGFKNILADDTFIYHYGSTSFKKEKAVLLAKNKKKLIKKHLWYPINVKLFLFFDKKVKGICKNIQNEINVGQNL
ncbi:glycosyltransferase family 2 protein [Bacillus sp. 1NLA3E]|uniref:glycosyltransferase family 2 protein n=1 Tax=Bacillus sp. 1NLA3E TaxID=666686 RepID=UPI000247EB8F|nr:glycosyltransferase family 2 protein [Bacillus sp. 1NLA3E]AGK55754.1 family 2 glycosyl transferase [Bacillus sp. 1NLA3E]